MSGRQTLPDDIAAVLGPDFQGTARYRRRFGRPKNLHPHERVWLVIDGADPCCRVALNTRPLGLVSGYALAARWEVTAALGERNELELEFEFRGAASHGTTSLRPGRECLPGGPIGEVRLEVTSSVLVDRFALETRQSAGGAAEVRVTGDLLGSADAPLELVVLLAGKEAFFQPLGTQPQFDFCFSVPHADAPQSDAPGAAGANLPIWPPGPRDSASLLVPFEARLLAGASAVWSTSGQTAARPVADWLSQQTSVSGRANADMPLTLPWDRPKWLADWREAWARQPGVRARVDAILGEAEYNGLDRLGVPVCQHLPAAWRSTVWPRLAHHPAIVEIVEH